MNKDRKDQLKQIANEKRERVSANRNFWRCINLDLGLSEDAYDRIAVIFQTWVFLLQFWLKWSIAYKFWLFQEVMGPSNPSGYLDLCGLCSRMLQKNCGFF